MVLKKRRCFRINSQEHQIGFFVIQFLFDSSVTHYCYGTFCKNYVRLWFDPWFAI